MLSCIYSRTAEKAHSRKLVVSSPATNIPFYSAQSSVTPCSCCLLPGYRHTCCEDLLRGATGCCSRVAGEFVLCSALRTARSIDYTGLSSQGGGRLPFLPILGNRVSVPVKRPVSL